MLHRAPLAATLIATLALPLACSREAVAGEDDISATPTVTSETPASLEVEVSGLRNADGAVYAYLYASAEGFPNGFAKALAQTKSSPAGAAASLRFADLTPGEYAVFVFHDENGNGELDKSLIGFPQEGIGVSNLKLNKPQRPRWSVAKFEVRGPTTKAISLRYL